MVKQRSYSLSKDWKMRGSNPNDLWARRKNLRYDILARYRGITKLITEEEGQLFEMADIVSSQLNMAAILKQFNKIASIRIRHRDPAAIPSKDSSGLWALRKKFRDELLARFRKVPKSVMEDESMDCTEETLVDRKLVSLQSQKSQAGTPCRDSSDLSKRQEPHWSRMAASKQQNYGSNSMKRSNTRFSGGHQRNEGFNSEKSFPQVQTQRNYPEKIRVTAPLHAEDSRPNFRQLQITNFYQRNPGNDFANGHSNHYKKPPLNQRQFPQQEQRGHYHSWNQTRSRGNMLQSRDQGSNSVHGPQRFGGQSVNRNVQNFRTLEVERRNLSAQSNNRNGTDRFFEFQSFSAQQEHWKNQNCGRYY